MKRDGLNSPFFGPKDPMYLLHVGHSTLCWILLCNKKQINEELGISRRGRGFFYDWVIG